MNEEEKKAIEKFKFCGGNFVLDKESSKVVLNLIENLQKENEKLKAKWDKDTHKLQNELDLTNADKINNYIPIQKVKEKIEELEEKMKHEYNRIILVQLFKQRKVLQELLNK